MIPLTGFNCGVNMAGRQSSSAELSHRSDNLDNAVELNESTLTEIVRRVYHSVQSVNEERPNPGNLSANASVEEEMAQRFCLPCHGQEQRPQPPKVNSRGFTNTRPKYNPQVNYGHSGVTRGNGIGKSSLQKPKRQLVLLIRRS